MALAIDESGLPYLIFAQSMDQFSCGREIAIDLPQLLNTMSCIVASNWSASDA